MWLVIYEPARLKLSLMFVIYAGFTSKKLNPPSRLITEIAKDVNAVGNNFLRR